MSQIAVPMTVRGTVTGILFVESETTRLAFRDDGEAAQQIFAAQAANTLWAGERGAAAAEPPQVEPRPAPPAGREVRVARHRFDDSVFVDGVYKVKGVARMLLRQMLEWHLSDGRGEFANRELRLGAGARMPEIKDNLGIRPQAEGQLARGSSEE